MSNIISEIKSLMARMEKVERDGSTLLTEASNNPVWRTPKGPNDLFDVIAGIGENKYVTMGYVRAVPELDLPNDCTLADYIGIPEAKSLIKVTVYNFRWQTNNTVRKDYSSWRKNYLLLGQQYVTNFQGLKEPTYHNTNLNYGKDGITAYDDDNEAKLGNTYTPINYHNLQNEWAKSTYYIVKEDGHIEEISPDMLSFKKQGETSIEKNIQTILSVGNDRIPQMIKDKLQNMDYRLFLHSNILFISATSDKQPVIYYNEFLSEELLETTGVDKNDLFQIAKDRYSADKAEEPATSPNN